MMTEINTTIVVGEYPSSPLPRFHPEFKSRPNKPLPPFKALLGDCMRVRTAKQNRRSKLEDWFFRGFVFFGYLTG
jgi:hypothetical protein